MASASISSPRVILICGYRRHGKDTLYRVTSGQDTQSKFDEYYLNDCLDHEKVFGAKTSTYVRIAFADTLKEDVAEVLGVTVEFLEENKDRPLRHAYTFDYLEPEKQDAPTYRDVLINQSARRKSGNPSYYPQKAFEKFLGVAPEKNVVLVVTDWRFDIEYEYACGAFGEENVSTVRVFNPTIGIPYYDIESEHEMDPHETHAVVQPQGTPLRGLYSVMGYKKTS